MTAPNLHDALSLVNQLSPDDQRELLRTLQEQLAEDDDSWALQGAQLAFMLQHHDEIETAYASEDMTFLDRLESSEEYRNLFGDMPWDEAYDRFEETWWDEGD
jgi:hypothetical protein